MLSPVEIKRSEDDFHNLLDRVYFPGSDHKVIRVIQAEDAVHGIDVIGRVSPIDLSL